MQIIQSLSSINVQSIDTQGNDPNESWICNDLLTDKVAVGISRKGMHHMTSLDDLLTKMHLHSITDDVCKTVGWRSIIA